MLHPAVVGHVAQPPALLVGKLIAADLDLAGNGLDARCELRHGRLEFAEAVRQLFSEIRFDAVAVELPETLRSYNFV